MAMMTAEAFVEPGRSALDPKPIPDIGPLHALVRFTSTTIRVTDVHVLNGGYPVAQGLTIGHEPVGIIERPGSAVQGHADGPRAIAGAITPLMWSNARQCGRCSRDVAGTKHGWKPMGGWRCGNTVDGAQAEYTLVPDAMANVAPVPENPSDAKVVMCMTSCLPDSAAPRVARSASATSWQCSRRGLSGCVQLRARG